MAMYTRMQRAIVVAMLLALMLTLGPTVTPVGAAGVGSWSNTGALASPRYGAAATTLRDGRVLVAGGSDGTRLDTAELYDAAAGRWAPTGHLNAVRSGHTTTLLADGRVLIVGGYSDSPDGYARSAEIYDPVSASWTAVPSMSIPSTGHAAVLLPNGKVLIFAGDGGATFYPSSRAELYDPSTNQWAATGALLAGGYNAATGTLLPDGRVLAVGQSWDQSLNVTQLYDPVTGAWSQTGQTSQPRRDHTATLLPSGKVLVAGGQSSTAEVYDPATGTWSGTGRMSAARPFHTAALLPDGRVLALGGWSQASAEIYDAASNAWSLTGAMSGPRNMHVTAVLPNGKILAAGGAVGSSPFLDTAEVFTLTGAFVSLSPGALTFGKQPLNTSGEAETVTLTNSGTTPVTIASTGLGGAHASDFAVGADTCVGATIAPGGSCMVGVNFTPRFAGARSAALQIGDDAPGSPHTVSLSGAGVIVPTIGGLSPTHARAGDPAATLTVTGTNFATGSVVHWGGSARPTTFVSATRLTAAITAADLVAAAVTDVVVVNPGGDSPTSPPAPFFVTSNGIEVTGVASGTSMSALGSASASMGGGPGTPGSLSAIAEGAGTITVARYGGNPGGSPSFGTGVGQTIGGYLDVYAAPGQRFTTVTIVNCALNGASSLFWWDGAIWLRASDQSATPTGCVTIVVGATSSPSLAQLTGTYVAAGRQLVFPDVATADPAAVAIRELSARGVIRGYGDGNFGPGNATLRAQMAALIARSMGWEAEDRGNRFPDQGMVDDALWRNVGALATRDVARGYGDGSYNPTGAVLNVQAILFISRAMVAKGFWQPQVDNPGLYPNLPGATEQERADRRDVATYVHYAGALPDALSGSGVLFVGWDQPSTRAWFARALWQALVSHYGTAALVP